MCVGGCGCVCVCVLRGGNKKDGVNTCAVFTLKLINFRKRNNVKGGIGKSYAGKKTVLIQRERKNTPIFKELKISVHIQGALFSDLNVFKFHNWLHIKYLL